MCVKFWPLDPPPVNPTPTASPRPVNRSYIRWWEKRLPHRPVRHTVPYYCITLPITETTRSPNAVQGNRPSAISPFSHPLTCAFLYRVIIVGSATGKSNGCRPSLLLIATPVRSRSLIFMIWRPVFVFAFCSCFWHSVLTRNLCYSSEGWRGWSTYSLRIKAPPTAIKEQHGQGRESTASSSWIHSAVIDIYSWNIPPVQGVHQTTKRAILFIKTFRL